MSDPAARRVEVGDLVCVSGCGFGWLEGRQGRVDAVQDGADPSATVFFTGQSYVELPCRHLVVVERPSPGKWNREPRIGDPVTVVKAPAGWGRLVGMKGRVADFCGDGVRFVLPDIGVFSLVKECLQLDDDVPLPVSPKATLKGREYRALKNHLHNTLGVSREELRGTVKEAVREMVDDALTRWFKTADFGYYIAKRFDWLLGQKMHEIKSFCATELMKNFEVRVERKA